VSAAFHLIRLVSPKLGTSELTLCIGEGRITEEQMGGEPFFDGKAELSPVVQSIWVTQPSGGQPKGNRCFRVDVGPSRSQPPWPISITAEQGEQAVGSLHRIGETALNALPDEVFLRLRKASALPMLTRSCSLRRKLEFPATGKDARVLTPAAATRLPESIDKLFEMPGGDIVRFR
jgi:hypothetical protein